MELQQNHLLGNYPGSGNALGLERKRGRGNGGSAWLWQSDGHDYAAAISRKRLGKGKKLLQFVAIRVRDNETVNGKRASGQVHSIPNACVRKTLGDTPRALRKERLKVERFPNPTSKAIWLML